MNRSKKSQMTFPENVMQTKDEYKTSRANKPLTERRRRERINNCLEELKSTILQGANIQEQRYAKMEKADILEMAVKYVKDLQHQQQGTFKNINQTAHNSYREGYNHCLQEVFQCLSVNPFVCEQVKHDLFLHLSQSANVNTTSDIPPTDSGAVFSHVSDSTGYSSYTSVSSDSMAYDSSSSRSLSRSSVTSDTYSTVPLAASTPTQFVTDGTRTTPVSPYVQFTPNQQVSHFFSQNTCYSSYTGQCSDSSSFGAHSDNVTSNSGVSDCDAKSKLSTDSDCQSTRLSEVWRPW